MPKIALVTGANRGIGLETCRQLAQLGLQVILGSRDPNKGAAAASSLEQDGTAIEPLGLDVTRPEQIEAARGWIEQRYGRLDVLVNNAGVYIDRGQSALTIPMGLAHQTLDANLFGAWQMCQAFIPLMQRNGYGRVVNVSSSMGALHQMGGYSPAYRLSKTGLNALTVVLAGEARSDNIKVNAVDPGWVRSDMGGSGASRSLEQGADTIVWLATLPDDGPTGGFFRDRKPMAW